MLLLYSCHSARPDLGKTFVRKSFNFSVLTKLGINRSAQLNLKEFINFNARFRSVSNEKRIYYFKKHPYFFRRDARAKKAKVAALAPKPATIPPKPVMPIFKILPRKKSSLNKKMLRRERLKFFNRRLFGKHRFGARIRRESRSFPSTSRPVYDGGLAVQNAAYSKIKDAEKKKLEDYRLLLKKKKERAKVRDVLTRCRSVTLSKFFAARRNKSKKKKVKKKKISKARKIYPWVYGRNEDERYFDSQFGQDIIDSKKKRFHMFKFNPITRKSLDLNPQKFFFYNMKRDPIYNSFLLEKVISSFATHGRHAKIRKIFYRIFLTDKYDYNIRTLYAVIGDLRPTYINVPVRMANRYYYAPIKASPMRSTMRAIRFFKMAVLSNKHEKSLEEKILAELENTFEFWGYVNPFYHDYVTMSENNKYLAHFRKRRVI